MTSSYNNIYMCSPYAIINSKTKMLVRGIVSNKSDKTIHQASLEICCYSNVNNLDKLLSAVPAAISHAMDDLRDTFKKLNVTGDFITLINKLAAIPCSTSCK